MFPKIKEAIQKFAGKKKVDKKAVEELIKEIQRALIMGDVSVDIVLKISENIKKRCLEEEKKESISLKEYVINVVYEELVNILGKEEPREEVGKKKVLLVGLFGSGKTTTTAKLAYYYKKKGLKVGVIAADTYRPAAYEQLKDLAEKAGVLFFGIKGEKKAEKVVKEGIKFLEKEKVDVVIVDSAGRNALDEELGKEIKKIYKELEPDEVYLVISADIGQAAKDQAPAFSSLIPLTGIIVTKIDSSAKGGGALTSAYLTGAKIKYIGSGERIEDLELYSPTRFVSRLLGMGDIQTLLEKVKEAVDEEKAKKIIEEEFNMEIFYEQLESMSKMGPLNKILDMLPLGGVKIPKDELEKQQERMKAWKYIIDSMTKEERRNPKIINQSRIARIAKGSGRKEEEVRELLKAYKQTEKMLKKMKSGKLLKNRELRKIMGNMDLNNLPIQ